MIKITQPFLSELSAKAKSSPRLRMNHNFHKDDDDTLQRMLNAIEPTTYIRPHKHIAPMKREAFVILTGSVAVVEFDENGNITESIVLDRNTGNYSVEITPASYHSIFALESNTVVYELKDGPYIQPLDKIFAEWAPAEGEPKAQTFIEKVLKQVITSI